MWRTVGVAEPQPRMSDVEIAHLWQRPCWRAGGHGGIYVSFQLIALLVAAYDGSVRTEKDYAGNSEIP